MHTNATTSLTNEGPPLAVLFLFKVRSNSEEVISVEKALPFEPFKFKPPWGFLNSSLLTAIIYLKMLNNVFKYDIV